MAVKDCDKLSNIIAVAIAAGDDDVARAVAELSVIKNESLQRSRAVSAAKEKVDPVTGLTPHELELRASSADIKIRSIVQASILKGEKGNEAMFELARQIKKTKGSLALGTMLIEKVRTVSLADYNDIARLWDDSVDPEVAVKDLNDGLAEFVSSNYSIRKYSDFYEGAVSKAKKKFKDGKITLDKYKEEVQKAHKDAMKKIAKGENPSGYVSLDKEWQSIKKVFGENPEKAGKVWSQYVMARELLADGGLDDDLLKAFENGGEALLGPIDYKWIDECQDLDVLLSRAFTNTEQLYTDGTLRNYYRDKLAQLASGRKLTDKNTQKIKTLINTSLFAEEGATLSDVLLDNRTFISAKQMGFKVTERDGAKIYNGLRQFAREMAKGEDKTILDGTVKIGNIEMEPRQILQLIYDITGDKNILALVDAGNFSDGAILNVATQKLLGDNQKAKASLLKLFQKGKEGTKITNSRGVFLKAITGLEVPDNAKVVFFDYREGLYYKDELSRAKADFMDKIADKNKMRVVSEGIENITKTREDTDENVKKLRDLIKEKAKGGFIIVNDGGFNDNPLLRKALNSLKEEDNVTMLFPRGGASSSFSMEDNVVFYKTTNDKLYDRVAGTISIQSLGDAKPTRELLASAYEAQTGMNGDKLRYQPSYNDGGVDNLGRQISDQQVEYGFYSDGNKNPITFYHYTKAQFDEFSLDHFREGNGDSEILGFFFTPNKDTRIGEKLKDADRIIEVYLKMDNPIDASASLNEVFTYDSLMQLFKDYHKSIGSTFDEERRSYKIAEWVGEGLSRPISVGSFLSKVPNGRGYEPFFGDGKAFMEFFSNRTGIDGVKQSNIEYIVFFPNQIKYVDNRLPTNDSRMMFQERELGEEELEDSLTDVQMGVIRDFIINQRERFSSKGYEEFIRNILYTNPNKFFNTIGFIISDKKKYMAQAYDLYVVVSKEREIWQAILNNKNNDKVLGDLAKTNAWETYDTIDRIYKELKEIVGRRKKTALARQKEDETFKELKGLEGAQFDTVIGKITDNGLSPIELGIVIDDNGKILSIGHGGPSSISNTDSLPGGIFYHSHPENGWFSGGHMLNRKLTKRIPTGGDLYTFSLDSGKYRKVGLINPGGVILEFANTPEFLRWADLSQNDLIQAINRVGPNYQNRIGTIQTALVVSLMTKEFDKQRWGIYKDIVDDYVDDVRRIVNNYMDDSNPLSYILTPNDRKELNRIGEEIKERVYALDMDTLINGVYSDDVGIGEMFKNSERVDNFGRKLTYGQSRYGFATVGDVEQLDESLNLGDMVTSSDVVRANYVGGDDMGYIVDFRPYRGGRASYIKFDPDNIVRSDDEFFRLVEEDTVNEYLGRRILGYHYSVELRDMLAKKTATIQEVMDEVGFHYNGAQFFRELMFDAGIEGYYDVATKQLRLFDLGSVKDANNLYPKKTNSRFFMRRSAMYNKQKDIAATDAFKLQMFTKDRTRGQIANGYGFPTRIVDGEMIEGVKAWGAWGRGFIWFTDLIKEGTAPHELFHAVFNTYVGAEQYNRVLDQSSKLFGVNKGKAEEILADGFAHWFLTGEFIYGDELKKLAGKKRFTKEQKTFLDKVLKFFEDLKEMLGLVDSHRAEVEQMYKDIVDMNYLPDAGKKVNADAAMVKYNDELNKAAVNYFGQVLGYSADTIDDEYVKRIETLLSDMLGIDVKSFDLFTDNSELWQRIDKQLSLERLTSGRFDKEFVDINKVRESINSMSDAQLSEEINKKFGILVKGGTIEGNKDISLIREARFDYNIANNTSDLLSAKGKIIALANGVKAPTLTIDELKSMFETNNFAEKYKEIFFPKQDVSKKDMDLFIRQINSDIFDGLSVKFAENLVKAGYSLPLINSKKLVYDYLNGKLDLNSDFIQSFFYKNEIPFTKDSLDTIIDMMMPREYSFDFDVLKGNLANTDIAGTVSAVVENPNRFLPDTYSALYAIEDSGKGITLGNKETKVLEEMLDRYNNAVINGMSKGTLKFGDAQKLKQELSYALDAFEQDFILPKYGKFLSPKEKQEILGIKYDIPIGISGQPLNKVSDMLNDTKERIIGNYKRVLGTMADNADINAAIAKGYNADVVPEELQKRIERRRDQLIANGSTIKEINGEYVVYNSKEALWETINNLPENIQGVAGLKALGREGIEELTNKQAYILLRYLEAAKSLATTANYATQLMYKQSPQLAQYSFFSNYVVDQSTGLPRIMKGNALDLDEFFDNIASKETADINIKKEIFENIVKKFKKNGYILAHTLEEDGKVIERGLDDIIKDAVTRQVDEMETIKFTPENKDTAREKMQNIYTNMFIPYTYLKDIPDGGTTKLGTKLENVKDKVTTTMREAYEQAVKDLQDAGATDADKIQKMITVQLDDGQVLNLDALSKLDADSWKQQIFNDKSILVRGADEETEFVVDETETLAKQQQIKEEEKEYRERIQNEYLTSLRTILNQGQSITDAERELMNSFMLDVRTDLRKYDLTAKLIDALDSLSGINEEVARGIKNYLIGFWGTVSFGKFTSKDIMKRLRLVKEAYEGYYNMTLEQLMKTLPKNQAEEVAWNTARYFKNLERLLGSVDGVTGVTTSNDVNKAFFHIGEVFKNLNTDPTNKSVRGIFSMLSAIEQNQVLKFFKFSNPGQASYYKPFVQNPKGGDAMIDGLGGYKDYVENINSITREQFNKLFGSNYNDEQFSRILQGLSGFTLSGGGLYRVLNKTLDVLNGSNIVFRFVMSYPGQLLTVPLQGVAYFLKQIGHELSLGIEDLYAIDEIREQFGILDGAYNELNIFGKLNFNPDSKDINSFYNRYGIPDIKEAYKNTGISTADDYVNMYAKVDAKYSKPGLLSQLARWFDPYKDNANNFIDGIFARNFKNIAFVKGLRDNNFMKFADASAFADFMNDPKVSADVKSKLMDAVAASSGRNFRNILGLGFGGLDRAIGGKGWQNILFGLMQMFNFRGSWGQNILKQTGAAFWNVLQYLGSHVGLTSATKDEIAKYLFRSPEFTNFMTAFMTDLEWAFKLARYQDNGRWPDEDADGIYYFLDYLSFIKENMNMVSQRWQGINSFGPARPFIEMMDSRLDHMMDPTVYQDTYGMGAFFNAFGKNFLRQRKPANWLLELVGAIESGGPAEGRAYIQNRLLNLSFGTIRYMVNEDMNGYGYTYEVTGQEGGIPGIVMGEAQMGSDKSFTYKLDNAETWNNIQLYFDSDIPWSERKVYGNNLWKALVNGSQFASSLKNLRGVTFGEFNKSYYTPDDLAGTIQNTQAGKEFYQKGYVTPRTNEEASIFVKTMLKNSEYRPGSSTFNKSLMNFEDFGHMDGNKGKEADSAMELWLEHMKYKTNDHGEFIKENGERVVEPSWDALITNVKQYYGNTDYVTNVIYEYAKAWLDIHSSDPNYQLYIKMLGQGQAHMLLENEIDRRVKELNIGLSKDDKWNKTKFEQSQYREMLLEMGNSILEGDRISFFDRLNRLDTDDATLAALDIIKEQATGEDRKILDKFYDVETSKIDGEVVESVTLKPQYESVLKQIGNIARAMDEGNSDRVAAMSSNLVNMYKSKDPTGIVTANLITSIFDRIYDSSNLSPSMKQEMMIGVFYTNKDQIQRNPTQMREMLGDNYDKYASLMNEMIYKWDGQVISNLESIQSSGEGDKKKTSSAKNLSNTFKDLAMNYGSKGGGTTNVGKKAGQGYGQWVPVKIQGADLVKDLGLKGYSPLNVTTVIKYSPHSDFSLKKDVNRLVNGPKTQQISNKKQLSNLEKKAIKAIEAES